MGLLLPSGLSNSTMSTKIFAVKYYRPRNVLLASMVPRLAPLVVATSAPGIGTLLSTSSGFWQRHRPGRGAQQHKVL